MVLMGSNVLYLVSLVVMWVSFVTTHQTIQSNNIKIETENFNIYVNYNIIQLCKIGFEENWP